MPVQRPIPVAFFRLDSGREPVRDWLKDQDQESRKEQARVDVETAASASNRGVELAHEGISSR